MKRPGLGHERNAYGFNKSNAKKILTITYLHSIFFANGLSNLANLNKKLLGTSLTMRFRIPFEMTLCVCEGGGGDVLVNIIWWMDSHI